MSDQVPVRWDEELAKHAKEVAALERPALSQISLRAGMMTYQKMPVPGNKMDVVIVASVFENKYFAGIKFDPNNYHPPVCYALDLTDTDMKPHPDVKEPESVRCADCQWNKWNSAGNGSKGKACKQVRRLALIPAAALNDGSVQNAELAVVSVPTTSVKNWGNYVNTIAAEYSRPPWGVITELRTEPDARTQFQLRFQTKGLVADEFLGAVYRRTQPAAEVLLTPYDESGTVAGVPDPLPNDNKKRKY